MSRPILIAGGGLAGLSTAYHLQEKRPTLLIERDTTPGGTARSYFFKGFTFDITGHLLHLHNPYTKKLIRGLLNNQFFTCVRDTRIFSNGTYTRYPFQAATAGLPENVIDDCVLGFFDAYLRKKKGNPRESFHEMCLRTFGAGISKHFMFPYNEKLYQVPARAMTADWCGPFVPMPKLEEVILGALRDQNRTFGYNATFLYPKKGGIQALAVNLAKRVKNIRMGVSVTGIDWRRRVATLSTGEKVSYAALVNTMPLPTLLRLMRPLPATIERMRTRLRSASILCLNLGVNRSRISSASWIYFPEKKYPFYRVGFPMNFTPHVVPKGCSSMYVEIPMKDVQGWSKKKILDRVRRGLIDARILKPSDRFPAVQFLPIPVAYVIYNRDRQKDLPNLFQFLEENAIQSIGRYGAWKYSFMEEAILDGKKAAERLLKKKAA